MKFEDFETIFRPSVRVLFDWDLARKAQLSVRKDIFTAFDTIGDIYTPWYLGGGRRDAYLEGGVPLMLKQLRGNEEGLDSLRWRKILMLARRLNDTNEAILAAAYSCNGIRILLEGNHRMAARHLHQLSNPILLVSLVGPCDEKILSDLRNFPLTLRSP